MLHFSSFSTSWKPSMPKYHQPLANAAQLCAASASAEATAVAQLKAASHCNCNKRLQVLGRSTAVLCRISMNPKLSQQYTNHLPTYHGCLYPALRAPHQNRRSDNWHLGFSGKDWSVWHSSLSALCHWHQEPCICNVGARFTASFRPAPLT